MVVEIGPTSEYDGCVTPSTVNVTLATRLWTPLRVCYPHVPSVPVVHVWGASAFQWYVAVASETGAAGAPVVTETAAAPIGTG